MKTFVVLVLACFVASAFADVYMHFPRGSNNRVDDNGNAPGNRLFDSENNGGAGYNSGGGAYKEYFYVGSKLQVEWTAQHECNGPRAHCEFVLQYMCHQNMRNGETRSQPPVSDNADVDYMTYEPPSEYGRHEPFSTYYKCNKRERNAGLFVAQQSSNGSAMRTRQNAGGGRSGFECSEERDFYPYWHPSDWKDIAVMTSDMDRCSLYQKESQNVMNKGECSDIISNNAAVCAARGGVWSEVGKWDLPAPECLPVPWSRTNHHGNAVMPNGQAFGMANYNWTIPDVPEAERSNCVLRIRYNMTSSDFDGWTIDSKSNGILSPTQNNPQVDLGYGENYLLQMQINTAQLGRVFEDRSHVFEIRPRPDNVPFFAEIWNLGVRGKRGGNAAVYPALEYDFVPNRLHLGQNSFLHIQWQGSEVNTQGNDRNNIVQIASLEHNYPMKLADFENDGQKMFPDAQLAQKIAFSGYLSTDGTAVDSNLQDAEPHFDAGLVQMTTPGEFSYMCTKNNQFSNRSQKGSLVVEPLVSVAGWIGISLGSVAAIGAGAAGFVLYKRKKASASASDF